MSQKSFEKPLYNEKVQAGKKTYYMDVRKTSNNKMYVSITESYTDQDGNKKNNRITIFPEHIDTFANAFENIQNFINKGGE